MIRCLSLTKRQRSYLLIVIDDAAFAIDCGFKMELDHIDPKANGGPDTIDNAIPVCFECHAEIHAYNDKHPRGRKYRPEELKKHKEQWLNLCTKSAAFASPVPARTDVGPFQALIDELEFNRAVTASTHDKHAIPLFETAMFDRCVSEGILITPQSSA